MSKQTPVFCMNGEDFPNKGFRNRCVTRLKAAMQQNPQNTLVCQFGADPFKAEEYYFEKSKEQTDSRSYYMTAITRALKHFKGPGPPFHPMPGLTTTTELPQPMEPAIVNQIQLRSSNRTSWPTQAFRDYVITKLQKDVEKNAGTVNRLGFPSNARQIESIVFALCEGSKEKYEKMLNQMGTPLLSEPVIREVKWVKVAERWTRISIMTNVSIKVNESMVVSESDSDRRTNFLMIPGNSGNEGYYEQFGRELIPLMGAKFGMVYFYTVSHLNHVPMPVELVRTGKSKPSDLFSLDEQIEHKKEFCREYLPKEGKLFVIGHSIGCYIALKCLSFLLENGWNLIMAYPLFPAIERLSDTPNGARLKPIAKFMNNHDKLTRLLFCWLKITPFWMKRCIVDGSLKPYGKCPKCISRAGAEVLVINCIRNVAHITCVEMEQIGEFDESLIAAKEYIRFYYGTGDYWILPEFVEQMRTRLPHQVIVDQHKQHHAFCLKDNVIMAKVIAGLIECETSPADKVENSFVSRSAGHFSFAADWFF